MSTRPAAPLPPTPSLVYAALTVQTLISAGTHLVAKRAMAEIHPLSLVLARFLLSASVFVLVLWLTPGAKLPPRGLWGRIAALGLLAGPLNQGCFFQGLSLSTPAHAALLYALTPIGVYLLELLRRTERIRPLAVGGISVAFGGVLILLLGGGLREDAGPLVGDLFILAAVGAWVLYTVEGRVLVARAGAVRSTAWTMTMGAVLLTPLMPFALHPGELAAASPTALGCILYLGLLTSVVSYQLWYYALSKTAASKVAVFTNLQPVATALAAWLFLGDPLTWEIGVGGTLVLAGVWAAQGR